MKLDFSITEGWKDIKNGPKYHPTHKPTEIWEVIFINYDSKFVSLKKSDFNQYDFRNVAFNTLKSGYKEVV